VDGDLGWAINTIESPQSVMLADAWANLVTAARPEPLLVIGTFIVMTVTFMGHGFLYNYLDFAHKPAALFMMKIQPKRHPKREVRKMFACFIVTFYSILCTGYRARLE
jgi:hypothetical protein